MTLAINPRHGLILILAASLAGCATPARDPAPEPEPHPPLASPAALKVVPFYGRFQVTSPDNRYRVTDNGEGDCTYYPNEVLATIRKRAIEREGGRAHISRTEPVPLNWNIRLCYYIARLEVRDIQKDRVVTVLTGHTMALRQLMFSPNGRWLAASSRDDTVGLWETVNFKEVRRLRDQPSGPSVYSRYQHIAFSPDSNSLASIHDSRWLLLHRIDRPEPPIEVRLGGNQAREIQFLRFSPDGRTIAIGDPLLVRVHDAATGREMRRIAAGNGQRFLDFSFAPDGRQLVTAMHTDDRRTIVWWDVDTGRQARTLMENQRMTTAIRYSPDGRWLATGGDDMVIRIRDSQTLAELHRVEYPRSPPRRSGAWESFGVISRLAFSPDGRTLYAEQASFSVPIPKP